MPNILIISSVKIFLCHGTKTAKSWRRYRRHDFALPGLVECSAQLDFHRRYCQNILTAPPFRNHLSSISLRKETKPTYENHRSHRRIQPIPQRPSIPSGANPRHIRRGLYHCRNQRRLYAARRPSPYPQIRPHRNGLAKRCGSCSGASCRLCRRKCGVFRHGRRIPSG